MEDQLGGDETAESGLQLVLGKTGDGTQQWVGKVASDRRDGARVPISNSSRIRLTIGFPSSMAVGNRAAKPLFARGAP